MEQRTMGTRGREQQGCGMMGMWNDTYSADHRMTIGDDPSPDDTPFMHHVQGVFVFVLFYVLVMAPSHSHEELILQGIAHSCNSI